MNFRFLRFPKRRILLNSLKISVVVGTILNVVNQWDALTGRTSVSWIHIALNYCVPFCVATYGAMMNDRERGEKD
jgi:hypothetical protein